MIKLTITGAIISKGYDGAPALQFSENGKAVRFKIGHRVYDKNAKDNHRYINLAVKAFTPLCERIEKMMLKEGSHINIAGRLDEDRWEKDGQEHSRLVVIIEDIEYSGSLPKADSNGNGNGFSNGNGNGYNNGKSNPAVPPTQKDHEKQRSHEQSPMPSGFTGYEHFGGDNPFFPA